MELIDAGEEIIMVLHSAGGFLGSNAIEGLSTRSLGSKRAVRHMVFLTAALYPEGFNFGPLPFFEKKASKEFSPHCSRFLTLPLGRRPYLQGTRTTSIRTAGHR